MKKHERMSADICARIWQLILETEKTGESPGKVIILTLELSTGQVINVTSSFLRDKTNQKDADEKK